RDRGQDDTQLQLDHSVYRGGWVRGRHPSRHGDSHRHRGAPTGRAHNNPSTAVVTMTSVRVSGFLPSTNGLHFANFWPSLPIWTITLPGNVVIPIGDASKGMCGGMTYTVRDMFQAGVLPPGDRTAPAGGPLYDYVASRLLDSFNLPYGPGIYLTLM